MHRHPLLQNVLTVGTRVGTRAMMVVLGFGLMVVGLAMGVSLVLLPVGVVIGLAGFLVTIWALFGEVPGPSPSP
jgi:hypothetical protein